MTGRAVCLSKASNSDVVRMFADEPDVMSVRKVAELLDVVPATVRREISRGNLECAHVGKCARLTKAALLRCLGEAS